MLEISSVGDFSHKDGQGVRQRMKWPGSGGEPPQPPAQEDRVSSARRPRGPAHGNSNWQPPGVLARASPPATKVRFPPGLPSPRPPPPPSRGPPPWPPARRACRARARAHTEPDSWWCWFAPAVPLGTQLRGARPRSDTTAHTRCGGRRGGAQAPRGK